MNIKKLKIGMKVKTINELVDFYTIVKVKKSVVWLKVDDIIFKNIKPNLIKNIQVQ